MEDLNTSKAGYGLLIVWFFSIVGIGSFLMSFHQPIRTFGTEHVTSISSADRGQWKVIHFLSQSCGCSQRVMLHLLDRHPFLGIAEEVLLVDGEESELPGTSNILHRLERQGFVVRHITPQEMVRRSGPHGVPVMLVSTAAGKAAYLGGYGSAGNRDGEIVEQIRSGHSPAPLPVLGCAIGAQLRKQIDPLRIIY